MTYLKYLEQAANHCFDIVNLWNETATIAATQYALDDNWQALEMLAKREHYNVLTDLMSLRVSCNIVCGWLYKIPGSSVKSDVDHLKIKDVEYGGSWHRRGGAGAFFSACRKWDRYQESLRRYGGSLEATIREDTRPEGVLDDLGDLRRYLILWEAWRLSKEAITVDLPTRKFDNLCNDE